MPRQVCGGLWVIAAGQADGALCMTQPLPPGPFACILSDPPWLHKTFNAKGLEGRPQHYDRMTLAEIKALPVADIAARDCHLFLWTTGSHLPQAFEVIKAWGFAYSGIGFVWIKLNKGEPAFWMERDFFTGMGYTTRKNAELCLRARRGSLKRLRKDIHELIIAPRREHSRKPAEARARIAQFAEGPRLEMLRESRRLDGRRAGTTPTNSPRPHAAPVSRNPR
jgi:N6-adenosine-specific RNA methylase IME4